MAKLKQKVDLILHPVRMRLLLSLVGQPHTAQELAEMLPDVPQATLYRHLNRLAEGGVVAVIEERAVRGATEKVYAADAHAGFVSPDEMAQASRDEHMRFFLAFMATLLDDYSRYLQRKHIDLLADGVGYRKHVLYLSEEEFAEFVQRLNESLAPFFQNEPTPDRTARLFSTIMMPGDGTIAAAEPQPVDQTTAAEQPDERSE